MLLGKLMLSDPDRLQLSETTCSGSQPTRTRHGLQNSGWADEPEQQQKDLAVRKSL